MGYLLLFFCLCGLLSVGYNQLPMRLPLPIFCGERAIQAVCRMKPNPNLQGDQYANIHGVVILTQRLTCFTYYSLQIKVNIEGLPADGRWTYHGFHVHDSGDQSNGCESMGPHYNPYGTVHGAPKDPVTRRHVGALGNVVKDPYGNVQGAMFDNIASLVGERSVVGRGMVLHEQEDDLGRGGNEESLRTGNSGRRLACCRIEPLY